MPIGVSDTTPEAARVQLDLLRAASPERRGAVALSLSRTVLTLARERLERAHPGEPPETIGVRLVELLYGRALAEAVRAELDARRP